MTQLVFIQNGRAVTDSLMVAEAFNKEHARVMRDIRELNCSEGFRLGNFAESSYTNAQGKQMPKYIITEQGFTLLAMGYTGTKAMEFKERYILEFDRMRQQLQSGFNFDQLSPELRYMIQMEQKHKELEERVDNLADGMVAVPEHTKVVQRVNDYARFTRLGHNEVYNKIYDIMKARYGIDIKQRVENERERINREHFEKTGKCYSESTLKKKVNGIDVMVREGTLDCFNQILVGMLDAVMRQAN